MWTQPRCPSTAGWTTHIHVSPSINAEKAVEPAGAGALRAMKQHPHPSASHTGSAPAPPCSAALVPSPAAPLAGTAVLLCPWPPSGIYPVGNESRECRTAVPSRQKTSLQAVRQAPLSSRENRSFLGLSRSEGAGQGPSPGRRASPVGPNAGEGELPLGPKKTATGPRGRGLRGEFVHMFTPPLPPSPPSHALFPEARSRPRLTSARTVRPG